MALILTEKKDSTGIITFNHADTRNALSEALITEITAALDGFKALDIRAVVLRAQPGIKIWSAAIRSAGTIRCAFSSAPSRNFPHR